MRRGSGIAATLLTAAVLAAVPVPAHATGIQDLQYWLDDYGIREAWNTTTGEGVTIAVIDTGVDSDHPDLSAAVVNGTDFSGAGSPDERRSVT